MNPEGGVVDWELLFPPQNTKRSLSTVVVTPGAHTFVEELLEELDETSSVDDESTPRNAMISTMAAVMVWDNVKVNVLAAASAESAIL